MFWYCIDNYDPNFNELSELKKLPITETKKNMIRQSLDTSIIFLKHFINDLRITDYIKPKKLYSAYEEYMNEKEKKKQMMNKNTFLEKLKDCSYIEFVFNKKLNGADPTNYIKIDRSKMIEHFKLKNYFDEYDEINGEVIDYNKQNDTDTAEQKLIKSLQEEIKLLKEQLEQKPKPQVEQTIFTRESLIRNYENAFQKTYNNKKLHTISEVNELQKSLKSSSVSSLSQDDKYYGCDTDDYSDDSSLNNFINDDNSDDETDDNNNDIIYELDIGGEEDDPILQSFK
jgi:hypothetical protein